MSSCCCSSPPPFRDELVSGGHPHRTHAPSPSTPQGETLNLQKDTETKGGVGVGSEGRVQREGTGGRGDLTFWLLRCESACFCVHCCRCWNPSGCVDQRGGANSGTTARIRPSDVLGILGYFHRFDAKRRNSRAAKVSFRHLRSVGFPSNVRIRRAQDPNVVALHP